MTAENRSPPPERGRPSRASGSGGGLTSKPDKASKTRFNRTRVKTERARELRVTATIAERKLWACLRRAKLEGFSFRRQHPVGPYILDFYCPSAALAVESDGGQHGTEAGLQHDVARTHFLNRKGIRVIRFSNHHLLTNLNDVLEGIYRMVVLTPTRSAPHSDLPLSGGGANSVDP